MQQPHGIQDRHTGGQRDDHACREDGYSTHLLAQEAVRLIREHDCTKPLFLYVPFNAVHEPHQVPESYKQPYAELKEPRRTYAGMVAALPERCGLLNGVEGPDALTAVLNSPDPGVGGSLGCASDRTRNIQFGAARVSRLSDQVAALNQADLRAGSC